MIPFGPWRPDMPPLGNPGLLKAEGVTPHLAHYHPMKKLSVFSGALTDRARGAVSGLDPSGNVLTFSGDETNLYRLTNDTWSDVSGATYTTGADERWNFCQYGDTMIALNFTDATQKWVLGTDSAFSALSATAPKARYCAIWGDFLVLGYTNDAGDGTVGFRIWWSPINSPTGVWTSSAATQADNQDLYSGQEVTGLVSGQPGIVLTRQSIYTSRYVGPDLIFQIDESLPGLGCTAPGSVATHGSRTFFWSDDGFYVTNGFEAQAIGANKFDDFFRGDWSGDLPRMSSAVDPLNKLYMLSYPTTSSDADRLLIYNWEVGEASVVPNQTIQALGKLLSPGFTMEQLDNISASLDALSSSLDSTEWKGGANFFGAFDGDNKFGTFGGLNHKALFETAARQLAAQRTEQDQLPGSTGFKSFVSGVRPLVDTVDVMVRLGKQNVPSDTVSWTNAKSPNTRTGVCKFHANDKPDARYHRAEITVAEDAVWTSAQGIDIAAEVSGSV